MANKTQKEAQLTRYLLGELSERERELMEEEYFEDDDAFEQMLVAEEELIDAYVHGELSAEKRQPFEELFLASPRGRERVQFARSLAEAMAAARPVETAQEVTRPPHPAFFAALTARGAALRFALISAMIAISLGFSWLLVERVGMQAELRQTRAENAVLSEKTQEMERRIAAEQARSALAQLEAERARSTQGSSQGVKATSQEHPPRKGREPGSRAGKIDAMVARQSPDQRRMRDGARTNTRATDTTVGSTSKSPGIPVPPVSAKASSDPTRDSLFKIPRAEELSSEELSSTAPLLVFTMRPGQVRGGGANIAEVTSKTTSIRFSLNLEADASYENYRAVIETADGKPVRRMEVSKPKREGRTPYIEFPSMPASELPSGDYILLLSGQRPNGNFERVADYSFKVVRE